MNKGITSILSYPERGKYGRSSYRGNCSGYLIRDLLGFFEPSRVFDPMQGSGTCGDVCRELNIDYTGLDLKEGFDLVSDDVPCGADLVFWHPPYHDLIVYSGQQWGEQPDPRDLSRCTNWGSFIEKLNLCSKKLLSCLRRNGLFVVLVGDIRRNGEYLSMQKDMDWYGSPHAVLIKQQHNAKSFGKNYTGRFIPIVHEYVLIFKRKDCYVIPVRNCSCVNKDIRNASIQTWRDVVYQALDSLEAYPSKGGVHLKEIYLEVEGHIKTKRNSHWREKVRQILRHRDFVRTGDARYALAA